MHEDKTVCNNIREGMGQWAEYIIKHGLYPVCLVTIAHIPEGAEVSFLKGPTMTDERIKEYLQFLLDNFDHFKQI